MMASLYGAIGLATAATAAAWWLARPGPDLSGRRHGAGWGIVELERTHDGGYDGTYSSTYGQAEGRIRLDWSPRTGRYEGTWSEGTFRFGKVSVWVTRDGAARGVYSADSNCEFQPGVPVHQEFQWIRSDQPDDYMVWRLR
jgi:hypothetical protein